jgi:predicted MFS family arabinose efflux permease
VSIQGATDSGMNLAAACSSALSGVVLGWGGYPALNGVAAVVLLPMAVLTLRTVLRLRSADDQEQLAAKAVGRGPVRDRR